MAEPTTTLSEHVVAFRVPGGMAWGNGPYTLKRPDGLTVTVHPMMVAFQTPDEWADEYEQGMEALGRELYDG